MSRVAEKLNAKKDDEAVDLVVDGVIAVKREIERAYQAAMQIPSAIAKIRSRLEEVPGNDGTDQAAVDELTTEWQKRFKTGA